MKTTTATNAPTIYANGSIVKLREYSQSYGAPETITATFIKEFSNEIWLCNEIGSHVRTMRKGTKVLISFSGDKITERAFTMRVNKAKEANRLAKIESDRIAEIARVEKEKADAIILEKMAPYFTSEKVEEIKTKLESKNSKGCKNYYKMKAIQLTGNYQNWPLVYKSIYKK